MENEFQEYVTFSVTTSQGETVELAVVDEFEYENRHYVAAARIQGDAVDQEGIYIYRCILHGDDFSVEKITDSEEYGKIAQAYMEL